MSINSLGSLRGLGKKVKSLATPAALAALAGTITTAVADKANGQIAPAAYELPNADPNMPSPNIYASPNAKEFGITYFTDGNDVNNVVFETSNENGTTVISPITEPVLVNRHPGMGDATYIDSQTGVLDLVENNFDGDIFVNGRRVWDNLNLNHVARVSKTFASKDGKFGLNIGGNIGGLNGSWSTNVIHIPYNRNSSDWYADMMNSLSGHGFFDVLSAHTESTRGSDSLSVGGRIEVRCTYDLANAEDGCRMLLVPQAGGDPINMEHIGNGVWMPENPPSLVGGVDHEFDTTGILTMTSMKGNPDYARAYAYDGNANQYGFVAFEAIGDTIVQQPVEVRIPAQFTPLDSNNNGIPDAQDTMPFIQQPGMVDVNNNGMPDAGDVECPSFANAQENGFSVCANNAGQALGYPVALRRAADGSRLLADAGMNFNLNGADLNVGGTGHVRWIHAREADKPVVASPNVQLDAPPAGMGYNVRIKVNSVENMAGAQGAIRVINAADILNGAAPQHDAPSDFVDIHFAGGTRPIFALEGTDVELEISLVERAGEPVQDAFVPPAPDAAPVDAAGIPVDGQDPDAAVPDAAIPDAAAPDAASPDAEVDAVVDAEVDAAVEDAFVANDRPENNISQCTPSNGGVEICDGLDNDCNVEVDEDIPNEVRHEQCGDVTVACVDGVMVDQNVVRVPTEEVCDGEDNNCDGQIDEGMGHPDSNACGDFMVACVNGQLVDQGRRDPSPEVCDGQDNDCDGMADGTNGVALVMDRFMDDCGQQHNIVCVAGNRQMQPAVPENCNMGTGGAGGEGGSMGGAGGSPEVGGSETGGSETGGSAAGGSMNEGGNGGQAAGGEPAQPVGGSENTGGELVGEPPAPATNAPSAAPSALASETTDGKGGSGGGCSTEPGRGNPDSLPAALGVLAGAALLASRKRKQEEELAQKSE